MAAQRRLIRVGHSADPDDAFMFHALANQGINVDCISSSEMTLSCIIRRDQADLGVKAVHDEFFAANESGKKAAAAVK